MNRMIVSGGLALALVAGLAWWLNSAPTPAQSELPFAAVNAQESDAETEEGAEATEEEIDTSTIVEMSMGNPDAEVTLIEYASFTCPHCAAFSKESAPTLKAQMIRSGSTIRSRMFASTNSGWRSSTGTSEGTTSPTAWMKSG